MTQPIQHRRHTARCAGIQRPRIRLAWTFNHNHRQLKRSRGFQLCYGSAAASVFRHNDVNPVGFKELTLKVRAVGTPVDDQFLMGQGHALRGRVNEAQQVKMVRTRCERRNTLTANSQEDTLGQITQSLHRFCNVLYAVPLVPGTGYPGRANKRGQWQIGSSAGAFCVSAHLHREGMSGVNHMRNPCLSQIPLQSCHTAKTTDACGNRLRLGRSNAPSVAEGGLDAGLCNRLRKGARFATAAENKKMRVHV